jgi:vacuolar-type H+-ATPase subunit H
MSEDSDKQTDTKSRILVEIREAEKKADEVIVNAVKEKESIMREAERDSSRLVSEKAEETKIANERKLASFRQKVQLLKEEKMSEGRKAVSQIALKAEKNIPEAAAFIVKKFEEMI